MARYGFHCPFVEPPYARGHDFDAYAPMGQAPPRALCPEHNALAERVFAAPQFQEDRVRFARNRNPAAPSERWSWSLGREMPETRSEQRRLERERGIELMTHEEARRARSEASAYLQHVRETGAPPPAPPPPKPEKGWFAREVAKRGIRFGADSGGYVERSREEVDRKLRAERPDWVEAEAAAPKK